MIKNCGCETKNILKFFCFKLENLAFQKGGIYLALGDKFFIKNYRALKNFDSKLYGVNLFF